MKGKRRRCLQSSYHPLLVARALAVLLDGALHHGVLAHQHHGVRAEALQPPSDQGFRRGAGPQCQERALRIIMSWLEPTLSACTTIALVYLSRYEQSCAPLVRLLFAPAAAAAAQPSSSSHLGIVLLLLEGARTARHLGCCWNDGTRTAARDSGRGDTSVSLPQVSIRTSRRLREGTRSRFTP